MNIQIITILITIILGWFITQNVLANEETIISEQTKNKVEKHPDSYWKNKLDPQTYQVTRCSATEVPFTGKYWNDHRTGNYICSNCGAILFNSKDKFDSHTGWPSFTKAQSGAITIRPDLSLGMKREEVICKRCGAHLGHLFADGPLPTGERFCINSAALNLDQSKPTNNTR